MNKFKHTIALIVIVAASLFTTSCEWSDVKDFLSKGGSGGGNSYYRFKIISTGDSFEGYYIVDGGDQVNIDTTNVVASSVTWSIAQNLNNPTSISILVSGVSTDTSAINIYIYQDNKVIKNEPGKIEVTGAKIKANLDFDFTTIATTTTKSLKSFDTLTPDSNGVNPSVENTPEIKPSTEEPAAPKTQEEVDKELIEKNQDLILF